MKLIGLICFFLCTAEQIHGNEGPIANTRLGKIQGSHMISSAGRNFLAFRGIPYAKPPTGHRRFKDPQPVDRWEALLNATREGPQCIQTSFLTWTVVGSEDCLVLNIYTHNLDSSGLRPVMVWIHGGGFLYGSGNGETDFYGPRYIMDRDIVLVTINYRLGPFGFLATEDAEAPGNYGLLDQTMALKWIQDHIDRFGGNPNSVTIFGESAGGASVHLHLLSPHSKGLFHRAIAQSGTSDCLWSLSISIGEVSKDLAKYFHCPVTSREMIECLQEVEAEDIIHFQEQLKKPGRFPMIFVPRIDVERSSPFIPRSPREIVESGQFNQVPFIAGMNQNEGSCITSSLLFKNSSDLEAVEEDVLGFVMDTLGFSKAKNGRLLAERVIQQYLDQGKPIRQQIAQLEQMVSDIFFFHGIDESVRLSVKHSSQPTYFYWYSYQGDLTLGKLLQLPSDVDLGVNHGDEILLMFSNPMLSITSAHDLQVSKILIDLWTSFAMRGKPVSDLAEPWLPSTENQPSYFNIDVSPKMIQGNYPFKHRVNAYKKILNEPQFRTDQIISYEGPIANTRLGKIQGSQMISSAGRNFLAFRGIPYAKPPTGHRRFKDPEPVGSWETIFNGTTEGPTCAQYNVMIKSLMGVEDCLVLNVYTHNLDSHNLRPVMVWIHGGGFLLGSGNGETDFYGPKYLLDRDIVLVTINYRLGPFGFFTTEDEEAPGNYGLLDQTLALQWVQDHIDRFGGDPKSVTIFGESAGSASVHFHMLSPRSKGLFHRAIAQSGAANCVWAISDYVGEYSAMLAKNLKCPTSSKEMVECLQQRTPEEILNFILFIQKPAGYPMAFQPRLDVERSSPFIDRLPKEILESGQFNQVPFIVGMNQNEGSCSTAMYLAGGDTKILKSIEDDLDDFARHLLGLELAPSDSQKTQQISKIIQRYLKTDKPLREQITELEQLVSDSMFFKCINDNVQLNAKYNPEPTYFYWYTHKGKLTFPLLFGTPSDIDFGVSHADELFLLFSLQSKLLTTGEDLKVSKILLDLWTSFAARGKPSSDLSETWLPSTEQEPRYLNINSNPELVHGQFPFKDRIAFWDQIGHDQVSVKTEL